MDGAIMTGDAGTIAFVCGGCERPFSVPRAFAGRRATCKTCGTKVVVPGLAEDPALHGQGHALASKTDPDAMNHHAQDGRAPTASHAIADMLASRRSTAPANGKSYSPMADGPDHSAVAFPAVPEAPPTDAQPSSAAELDARSAGPDVAAEQSSPVLRRPGHIGIISEAQAPPGGPPPTASADGAAAPAVKIPVRIRRLMVDAEQMRRAFPRGGPISVKSAVGDPPEKYQVEYKINGLQRGWLGRPKKRAQHLVEIQLTSEYPRVSPKCKMLTPVFHPNIDETMICVGDHWTAGECLVDLVIRIGEMLAYQAYNIKSPLDGQAAMWADLHPAKLPTDSRNFHVGEVE